MAGTELVKCPMLKENIDVAYCIELQMIANKEIKPTQTEEHFTAKRLCGLFKMQETGLSYS